MPRSPDRTNAVRLAIRDAAVRAGLVDTELATLADTSALRFGDDGFVYGADDAIEALRQHQPSWFITNLGD